MVRSNLLVYFHYTIVIYLALSRLKGMTAEKARELYKEYLELDLKIDELIDTARNIPKNLAQIKLLQFSLLREKLDLVKTLREDCYQYLNLQDWEWEELR